MTGAAFIGAGIGHRRAHHDDLLSTAREASARPDMLEIIPGHFATDPDAILPLAERYPLVLHEVGLSIGTARADGPPHRLDAIDRALVGRMRALVDRARPLLVSDHLAMTRTPSGIDLGHLCPIPLTEETLALVSDRVRALQDALGVPIALENIALPFELGASAVTGESAIADPIADEIAEPEWLTRLVEATGCGLLLDLTNLVANGNNFGFDPFVRVLRYPLESVLQVHLAGSVVSRSSSRAFWVDTHSEPVDEDSYALLRTIAPRASNLIAIVVERDEKIPSLDELVRESHRARSVWRDATA